MASLSCTIHRKVAKKQCRGDKRQLQPFNEDNLTKLPVPVKSAITTHLYFCQFYGPGNENQYFPITLKKSVYIKKEKNKYQKVT